MLKCIESQIGLFKDDITVMISHLLHTIQLARYQQTSLMNPNHPSYSSSLPRDQDVPSEHWLCHRISQWMAVATHLHDRMYKYPQERYTKNISLFFKPSLSVPLTTSLQKFKLFFVSLFGTDVQGFAYLCYTFLTTEEAWVYPTFNGKTG